MPDLAHFVYYLGVHLLYASLVWCGAWVLCSWHSGSATTKYWIWLATALNFVIPSGAIIDRVWSSHLAWARPLVMVGAAGGAANRHRGVAAAAGLVWLSGAALMLLRLGLRLRREQRSAAVGRPLATWLERGIPVRVAADGQAPAVAGLWRPHISLPAGIDRLLSAAELDAVLLHELTHARRRDNLVRLIYELGLCLGLALLLAGGAAAQRAETLAPAVGQYVKVGTPVVILEHVEIIDGTGADLLRDRNVRLEGGRISAILPGADQPASDGITVLDLRGHAVLPGIVGMHDHLFALALPAIGADNGYNRPAMFVPMTYSAPRLYVANGVTTIRTAGSIEPQTDVRLGQAIEGGRLPGPHLDVTGPYLEGTSSGNALLQMHQLSGPEDARQTVAYWADRGVTSFKAYQNITRAELRAAIEEAHARGLKVTGHLCSVSYPEAIELGIDNLEHGFFVDTERDPGKKPDTCSASRGDETLEHTLPGSPEAQRLIQLLVGHHVALTSTLVGAAASRPGDGSADGRPLLRPAILEAMAPAARDAYLYSRNQSRSPEESAKSALLLRREMDLEREFVAAGGLLLAGPDPVGLGGNLPGFGDQREIELLVEAGFSPVEAIRIATLNGAVFLGRERRIGSIAAGKNADLVVVKGDPTARIADIENIEIVFKDGVGYDPRLLLDSVKGRYGQY